VPRPKAYSYIRMSTADQAKGDSTRRQHDATIRYAEEHNLELAQIIIDEGVSAFTGMNAEFGKLGLFIDEAENGKIEKGSYLIVESLDRISRQNFSEAFNLLNKIIKFGVNVVTLSDNQVYNKETLSLRPNDLLMAIFTFIRAHEESQIKSIRLKASWENKRSLAQSGKKTRHVIPKWLRYSDSGMEIEPIPERADIIREIFGLSCSGWGAYSIAKKLNAKGYDTWGNARFWQESYVKKILNNRSVIGEFQPHVINRDSNKIVRSKIGDPIKSYYPSIIDEKTFLAAQDSSKNRLINGKGRKGKGLSNLFSGLLFCHYCGNSIRFTNKGAPPKGGTYLRCSNAVLTGKCNSNSYNYKNVENILINILQQLDMKKITLDKDYSSVLSKLGEEKTFYENKIKSLLEDRDYLTKLRDRTKLEHVAQELEKIEILKNESEKKLSDINSQIRNISIPETGINEKIYLYLNEKNHSDEQMYLARNSISHAIKGLVRKIIIHEDVIYPWEQLEEVIDEPKRCINFHIYYRNGASQVWYGANDSNLYMPPSEKMQLLRQRLAIERRE
jgi:DNA invertase Pin-like site-specific DNA recombinase